MASNWICHGKCLQIFPMCFVIIWRKETWTGRSSFSSASSTSRRLWVSFDSNIVPPIQSCLRIYFGLSAAGVLQWAHTDFGHTEPMKLISFFGWCSSFLLGSSIVCDVDVLDVRMRLCWKCILREFSCRLSTFYIVLTLVTIFNNFYTFLQWINVKMSQNCTATIDWIFGKSG